MRFIDLHVSGTLSFKEFTEPNLPKYVIVSHTWREDEITFQEFEEHIARPTEGPFKKGFDKVNSFVAAVRALGVQYAWIDTCCINKESSAELTEAINSMYRLYQKSSICIIYLSDVDEPSVGRDGPILDRAWLRMFRSTRWLKRGWCLQELLAARQRRFYTKNWEPLPESTAILEAICDQTNIPMRALEDFRPQRWSVAEKMSWAADRETQRPEDRAYSLMGIFAVNMSLKYGEGENAFLRLQQAIIKQYEDYTIFCWTSSSSFSQWKGLLARSPKDFENSAKIINRGVGQLETYPIHATNQGLRLTLRLRPRNPADAAPKEFFALLKCSPDGGSRACGLWIRRIASNNYIRVDADKIPDISPAELKTMCEDIKPQNIIMKPDFRRTNVYGCDCCSRIAGFLHPRIYDNDMRHSWKLVEDAVTSNISRVGTIWPFPVLDGVHGHEQRIMQFKMTRGGCAITIAIKYDINKRYGASNIGRSIHNDENGVSSPWLESNCCEWKVVSRQNCAGYDLKLDSWIELDETDEAYIHLLLNESGDHTSCARALQTSRLRTITRLLTQQGVAMDTSSPTSVLELNEIPRLVSSILAPVTANKLNKRPIHARSPSISVSSPASKKVKTTAASIVDADVSIAASCGAEAWGDWSNAPVLFHHDTGGYWDKPRGFVGRNDAFPWVGFDVDARMQ